MVIMADGSSQDMMQTQTSLASDPNAISQISSPNVELSQSGTKPKTGRLSTLEQELEKLHQARQRPSITVASASPVTTSLVTQQSQIAAKTTPTSAANLQPVTSLSAPVVARKISRFQVSAVDPNKLADAEASGSPNPVADPNSMVLSSSQNNNQPIDMSSTVPGGMIDESKRELKLDLSPSSNNVVLNNLKAETMSPIGKFMTTAQTNINCKFTKHLF
jgi:hypothetical protein